MHHLRFKDPIASQKAYLGGLPLLDDCKSWPTCPKTGQPQLLLLTLKPNFFFIPTIKSDECISVFVSYDYSKGGGNLALTRELAITSNDDTNKVKNGFARVILHKMASTPCPMPTNDYPILKEKSIELEKFSDDEAKEEVAEPGRGTEISKFVGIPGWLQDDITFGMKFGYLLQVNEIDISRISPAHEGIFREGVGYLFLNRNSKKLNSPCEVGYFFIQFT